jgi:integrase
MPHAKGTPVPWLVPKTRRRTVQNDIEEYLEPKEIYKLIFIKEWSYKGGQFNKKGTQYGRDKLHARDRALLALLYLTSGRINEILKITKYQFREMRELSYYKNPNPKILILHNFWVSKRRKAHTRKKAVWDIEKEKWKTKLINVPASRHPMLDIPLFRTGRFAPFTQLVEEYLRYLHGDKKLFNFGTSRAWVIVNHITGKWNHYFRAQSLSFLVNVIRSALKVAKQRGVENPTTIAHYYKGDWLGSIDDLISGESLVPKRVMPDIPEEEPEVIPSPKKTPKKSKSSSMTDEEYRKRLEKWSK